MIYRFNPDDDVYGRRLYLIYGSAHEIRRRLKRFGADHNWTDFNAGQFIQKTIKLKSLGKCRHYFLCIERAGSRLHIEGTLLHEVHHFCVAVFKDLDMRGAHSHVGMEEAFSYYQEWMAKRCLKVIRRAGF